MALTVTPTSIETYLATAYDPDVDFVDGQLEDRNVGEYEHNMVQRAILFWFYEHERQWKIRSIQEQRTRVAPTRFRLPDVSVFLRSTPVEQVFTSPQLIAIEVLSPRDQRSRMDRKIGHYIDFGVVNIWVVDPATRAAWDCSSGPWISKEQLEVPGSPIYLSLPSLFARIDEDEAD